MFVVNFIFLSGYTHSFPLFCFAEHIGPLPHCIRMFIIPSSSSHAILVATRRKLLDSPTPSLLAPLEAVLPSQSRMTTRASGSSGTMPKLQRPASLVCQRLCLLILSHNCSLLTFEPKHAESVVSFIIIAPREDKLLYYCRAYTYVVICKDYLLSSPEYTLRKYVL